MVKKSSSVLLAQHIYPHHYNIFLQPDLDNFIFQGEETIDIELAKQDTSITLHSAEIEVLSAHISYNKKEFTAEKISYNDSAETVTFLFAQKIPLGKAQLKIAFSGILNNKMRGFYRSRYEHEGKVYHMGVTQFESTDARRAFPCFDEPAQKATFEISLKVPSDRTVISNTLEEEIVEHDGGFKVVRFEKSPKMSSYLLAFIIGHFEFIESRTPEGVKVRVYVTPGKKDQAKFALDAANKIMSFYHHYFGIAYPLPTMDLIAIPDFANGAMENWGAVTYRETALLVDEEHSSLHNRQWVALIIAHELAHQWFGNLVTMKWWTHLWLNEGFASFMEYLAVDKLFPKWRIWTQFVYTEQARALTLDGLENTHAIEIPVHHPGEISEIFDAVSYSKGASVIRMLEAYVGEKNFQKGLSHYLKTHQYSNAETEDLWRALEKVSGKPVEKIMKNWTSKPGYPLVTVVEKGGKIILSQKRFYASPTLSKKETTKWLVPVDIISDDKKKPKSFLLESASLPITGFEKSKWLKANASDTSFFRVKYDPKNLLALDAPIRSMDERLGEEGRFALVRDAFALVESGDISTDEALTLLMSYKNEKSYIVWAEIISHLIEMKGLLFGTAPEPRFSEFALSILQDVSSRVGWSKAKGESHEHTLLRSAVLYAYGTFGDKKTVMHVKDLFEKRNKNKIDSDIRGLIYSVTAENGSKKEYSAFKDIYMKASLEEEKDRALRALCSFKEKDLLRETLDLAFSDSVRAQDAMKAVYLMSANPIGVDITWEYVKENWKSIHEKFAGGHLFARFVSPFAKFTEEKKAKEIDAFFKKNKAEGISRTVAQTLEKIRSNSSLLKRDLKKIEEFLVFSPQER